MNCRQNENLCLFFILTSKLNCGKENNDFTHTCCFDKEMLPNLKCILIYSLTV